jgi:hypothetical protein
LLIVSGARKALEDLKRMTIDEPATHDSRFTIHEENRKEKIKPALARPALTTHNSLLTWSGLPPFMHPHPLIGVFADLLFNKICKYLGVVTYIFVFVASDLH